MADIHAGSPFGETDDGVRVAIRVAPRASRDAVQGLTNDGRALKVAVTAPPANGKANAAVIKLLAKQWRVPKTAFRVVSGAATRAKVLHVTGDPSVLMSRLKRWENGDK